MQHFDWLLSGPKPAVYTALGRTSSHQQRHNTFEQVAPWHQSNSNKVAELRYLGKFDTSWTPPPARRHFHWVGLGASFVHGGGGGGGVEHKVTPLTASKQKFK